MAMSFGMMRLSKKIPLTVFAAVLVSSVLLGLIAYSSTSTIVHSLTQSSLEALVKTKESRISDRLASIDRNLLITAHAPLVLSAMRQFKQSWNSLEGNQMALLQKTYITDNPNKLGEKEKLDFAPTGTLYDNAHRRYHPAFRDLLYKQGYYDIFLFDLDGNLIYTVFKELDYATNLNTGEWKNTDLGNAYRAALKANPGSISFFDFKPYGPSHGAPASFISTPILDSRNKLTGVLVYQLPNIADEILSDRTGLGKLGEFMVVGEDGKMRNDSPFSEESEFLNTTVAAPSIDSAIQGSGDISIIDTYRGMEMEIVTAPLEYHGARWAVVAAVSVDEVNIPVNGLRNTIALITLVLVVVIGLIGWVISLGITKPIASLLKEMDALSNDDLSVKLRSLHRPDEIGDMSRAVQVFKENAEKRMALELSADNERSKEARRQEYMENLIEEFREAISSVLGSMGSENKKMQSTAGNLNTASELATSEAGAAKTASNSASANVQTVASAAEELSSSIKEIAAQSGRTYDVVTKLRGIADAANKDVSGLANSVEKIGEVVEMIRDIAEQTNLLALNATIEAARAGEAGRGFAVVAAEVKELSNQTAKATEEIANQINSVQSSTENAVIAIGNITQAVGEIDDMTASIASSSDEQDAATQEISKSIVLAATGSTQASESVDGVSSAIEDTNREAVHVQDVTNRLAEVAEKLSKSVEQFLEDVTSDVAERRTSLRKRTSESGRIRHRGVEYDISIVDKSEGGIGIEQGPGDLGVGDLITLSWSNGKLEKMRVQWINGDKAGFAYLVSASSTGALEVGDTEKTSKAA
ncbi:MAG: chemotaxis protein [Hyphomicrobiales bacterium]|nr:MAG: chemotaxis protein [Hyphomicrobiales bacterium]